MISLHIAKLLSDNGFGVLALTGNEADAEIFWEEIPVDSKGVSKDGLWVVTRGLPINRFTSVQAVDIYSRYANKLSGSRKLEDVINFLKEAYAEVCVLPIIEGYSETLYQAVIEPSSSIENVGSDAQDKVVRVVSAQVNYKTIEES
jgi:hypothetical protein